MSPEPLIDVSLGTIAILAWGGVVSYYLLALVAARFKAPPRIDRSKGPDVMDLREWRGRK